MAGTNWFIDLISHPYAKGLLTGLFFCVVLLVRHMLQKRELKSELHTLRKHLHTKLEIDAEENVRRKDSLERLKKEAENLRVTVQTLQQKPGRKELRQYYIYQKALDKMLEKAPCSARLNSSSASRRAWSLFSTGWSPCLRLRRSRNLKK